MKSIIDDYFVDMDEIEPLCIAGRVKNRAMFLYPYMEEVAKSGAKIVTRDGRLVKHVHTAQEGDRKIVVGVIDDETLTWDIAGRKVNATVDDPLDLYIPERYFMKRWKDYITLGSAAWAMKFQLPHPYLQNNEQ